MIALSLTEVLLVLIAAVRNKIPLKLSKLLWVLGSMWCWYCYWLLHNVRSCASFTKFLSIDFLILRMNHRLKWICLQHVLFCLPSSWLNSSIPHLNSVSIRNDAKGSTTHLFIWLSFMAMAHRYLFIN